MKEVTRDDAIRLIRSALKRRSGQGWSVTHGNGTASEWIAIDAPPARCTWRYRLRAGVTTDRPEDYEEYDSGSPGGNIGPEDRAMLARLLGVAKVHPQGVNVPASEQYYAEYVDRAEGRVPAVVGVPYWD